jgi:hypothetical protein
LTGDGEAPKNEFESFLGDIAEEISHRVESMPRPVRAKTGEFRAFNVERHVLDWPSVADRMIEEMG